MGAGNRENAKEEKIHSSGGPKAQKPRHEIWAQLEEDNALISQQNKAQLHHAIMQSKEVIQEVFDEFAKLTGRKYNIVEKYDAICYVGNRNSLEKEEFYGKVCNGS